MPFPLNHEAWQEKKDKFAAEKSDRRGKRDHDKSSDNKGSDAGAITKSLKLALNRKLTTALVTQHHFSQNEANDQFNSCYIEADEASN